MVETKCLPLGQQTATMRTHRPNTNGVLGFLLAIAVFVGVFLFMSNRLLLGGGEENDAVVLKQTLIDHRRLKAEHAEVQEKLRVSQAAYRKLNEAYKTTQQKLTEGLENYEKLDGKNSNVEKKLYSATLNLDKAKAERDKLGEEVAKVQGEKEMLEKEVADLHLEVEDWKTKSSEEQLKGIAKEQQKEQKKDEEQGEKPVVLVEPAADKTNTTHKPLENQPLEKRGEEATGTAATVDGGENAEDDTAGETGTGGEAGAGEFGDAGWPREPFRQDVLEGGIKQT